MSVREMRRTVYQGISRCILKYLKQDDDSLLSQSTWDAALISPLSSALTISQVTACSKRSAKADDTLGSGPVTSR